MKQFVKLKENWEFNRTYRRGDSYVCPMLVIYICRGRKNFTRLGITAGKKLGCAVKRNRAKRVITAAFRECAEHIPLGYDFVIVARTRILGCKSTEVAAALQQRLEKANLWEK